MIRVWKGFVSVSRQAGFSLVEAAIIITVLGLVIAPFFGHLTRQHERKELMQEERNLEAITSALAVFVAENGRYPVPADAAQNPASATFGQEVVVTAPPGACTLNVCVFNSLESNNAAPPDFLQRVYIGALPTRALRLPPEFAANIHGYKYFYAVSAALTDPIEFTSRQGEITVWVDGDDDGLVGVDAANVPLDNNGITPPGVNGDFALNSVHFVVVDPGADGKGALSLEGTVSSFACTNPVAGDYQNCEFTGGGANPTVFVDTSLARAANPQSAAHFDDKIVYSLARKETTFWEINRASGADGTVNIGTRSEGNIGINRDPAGTPMPAPRERLHIVGGNIAVNGEDSGVSLEATGDVEAVEAEVRADDGALDAGDMIGTGGAFYYP